MTYFFVKSGSLTDDEGTKHLILILFLLMMIASESRQ